MKKLFFLTVLFICFTIISGFSTPAETDTTLSTLFKKHNNVNKKLVEKKLEDYKQKLLNKLSGLDTTLVRKNWEFVWKMFKKENTDNHAYIWLVKSTAWTFHDCTIEGIRLGTHGLNRVPTINGFHKKPYINIDMVKTIDLWKTVEKVESKFYRMKTIEELDREKFMKSLKQRIQSQIRYMEKELE
jgi:hypothetical protein